MLLGPGIPILPSTIPALFCIPLFLLARVSSALSQKERPSYASVPKYDLQTETKTEGVVEEVNLLPMETRKDFRELIINSGDDKVHLYVCPEPFQEKMGISFSRRDEIAVTGSKVKREASDVILAREVVKGTDTLLFRDDKGNPAWDWRTGK